jgi:putative PIN family toxin of toxin-antitoxin system
MLRAVLDTNVVLAAELSCGPQSPNREIMKRWLRGEFTWLVTEDVTAEYAEKLLAKGKPPLLVEEFLTELLLLAETVEIRFFHFRHYPVDSDDTVFLLCALNGTATHLVSYDRHLLDIGIFYEDFSICRPADFLSALTELEVG